MMMTFMPSDGIRWMAMEYSAPTSASRITGVSFSEEDAGPNAKPAIGRPSPLPELRRRGEWDMGTPRDLYLPLGSRLAAPGRPFPTLERNRHHCIASLNMSPLASVISRATTLPSAAQLRRSRTWISNIANAFFIFWVWRYVYLEAYRYVRAKGMMGVGHDGFNKIKRVSCPFRKKMLSV